MNKKDISILLPLATSWAEAQEAYILQYGTALNEDQQIDAYLTGVKHPDKIRIVRTTSIPLPEVHALRSKLADMGILNDGTAALCLRHGIYISENYWNNRRILVHEFVHTMQYERSGSMEKFLEQYILECLNYGYPFGSLEMEARKIEETICKH
jgi:hypothetical protein